MVVFMLLLKIHNNDLSFVKIPFLQKVFKDIKKYIKDAYRFDPNFIPVAFLFLKDIMIPAMGS